MKERIVMMTPETTGGATATVSPTAAAAVALAEPAIVPTTDKPIMSGLAAVRLALAANPELTGDAGAQFVKDNYNVEVSGKTFGVYKSQILNKKGRKAAKPKTMNATTTATPPDAVASLRLLVNKLGREGTIEL